MSCYNENISKVVGDGAENKSLISVIGCIELTEDNTTDKTCTEEKAALNTYIYEDFNEGVALFKLCFSPKIGTNTQFTYMTMIIKNDFDDLFMLTNDATQFLNSNPNDINIVKINKNWIIPVNSK